MNASVPDQAQCPGCGVRLSRFAVSCPGCFRLVHAEQLEVIAEQARAAAAANYLTEELRLWRSALDLLPTDSKQHAAISERVNLLSKAIDRSPAPASHTEPPAWIRRLGPLAPVLLILWKFKVIILAVLTKGKLLLLGLTKLSTFSTMLLTIGAYTMMYGWPFAVGLVLAIYVHEMGHVYALQQFGFAASAPTFIPFFGAFVRMKQHPANPSEDARVGLAGPIWGTAAAIVLYAAWVVTAAPVLAGIAHFAAWLNLFNLMPVWQLDGGRGMRALSRQQRIILLVVIAATGILTREGFFAILAGLTIYKLTRQDWPEEGDSKALFQFCAVLIVLGMLMAIPLPIPVEMGQ